MDTIEQRNTTRNRERLCDIINDTFLTPITSALSTLSVDTGTSLQSTNSTSGSHVVLTVILSLLDGGGLSNGLGGVSNGFREGVSSWGGSINRIIMTS